MHNIFLTLVTIFFLSENVFGQGTTYKCNPQVDCQTAGIPGVYVPDPSDCEKYFVCLSSGSEIIPSSQPLQCPQNQYFNQTAGQCTAESTAGICPNICIDNGVCSTQCPLPSPTTILVADPTDCGIYYICDGNTNYTGRCPPNLPYFNGVSCVADQSQCCQCIPYCPTPFIQIQDPCNCHAYFLCQIKGQPHEVNRIVCNEGYYFDESANHCMAGTCNSVCTNCENSLSTTTLPTTTTVITLPTTAAGNNCQSTYNCPTDGNFPRCNYCDPTYFNCKGGIATIEYCTGNTVFNPSIQYPFCIPPENCPF